MLIYSASGWLGQFGLLFHIVGSPLYNRKSLPQALFSAAVAVMAVDATNVNEWLDDNVASPTPYFSSFAFFAAFIVVHRTQAAVTRFQVAQQNYSLMASHLLDTAVAIKAFCLYEDMSEPPLRKVMFRWLRLYHKLAIARFLGLPFRQSCSREKDNLITPGEYDILHPTRHRAPLVLSWVQQAVVMRDDCFHTPPALLGRIYALSASTNTYFHECANISDSPFPFPYLQVSLLILHIWCIFTPFIIARFITSTVFAALASGLSTWILFAINEAAAELENPFDSSTVNDLPLRYYEHVFATDMDAIEFAALPEQLRRPAAASNKGGPGVKVGEDAEEGADMEIATEGEQETDKEDIKEDIKEGEAEAGNEEASVPIVEKRKLPLSPMSFDSQTVSVSMDGLGDSAEARPGTEPAVAEEAAEEVLESSSQVEPPTKASSGPQAASVGIGFEQRLVGRAVEFGRGRFDLVNSIVRRRSRARNEITACTPYECAPVEGNMYVNYTHFATKHLPVDDEPLYRRAGKFLGVSHAHTTTRDVLEDPAGNPGYMRRRNSSAMVVIS